jgi:hypothetical protein
MNGGVVSAGRLPTRKEQNAFPRLPATRAFRVRTRPDNTVRFPRFHW